MEKRKKFLYLGKHIWYKSLAVCLKGSRNFFKEKSRKYKNLARGIAPVSDSPILPTSAWDIAVGAGQYPYRPFEEQKLNLQAIKKIISNPQIKVVSFDIFDTLLYRPCFNPTDLFYLLANKVNKQYDVDFISLRLKAEEELGNPYATLQDIYNHIQEKNTLDKSTVARLYEEELACEKQLLTVRTDVRKLYEYALSQHKRIIATSDMYLPASFLKEVLEANGYKNIEKVYVSNEYKARKDDGSLFKKVLREEKIQNTDILHIGDNKKSDFEIPLSLHILAVYYPSLKDLIFNDKSIYNALLAANPQLSADPVTRTVLAFGLFRTFENSSHAPKGPAMWDNIQQFTNIVLGPVLFYVSHFMATNPAIQAHYDCIHFAARDGFLPKIAYDILTKHIQTIPSNYLYASRRAYYPLFYNSVEEFIKDSIHLDSLESLTFRGLLEQIIIDKNVLDTVFHKLPDSILQALVKYRLDECLKSLRAVDNELHEYLQVNRGRATAYYRKQLVTTTGRELVFDLGYSGSISRALSKIAGCPVDKVYFWQTHTNIKSDQHDGTKTFSLFNDVSFRQRICLLYEEIFSPLQGSALGFDKDLKPILEKLSVSASMKQTFATLRTETEHFMKDICTRFGPYLVHLNVKDPDELHCVALYMLEHSPYAETELFKDIIFQDPLARDFDATLESKLSVLREKNVISGTGFDNPKNYISEQALLAAQATQEKIGIHVHLFHSDIGQELLSYLERFPFQFDLYITVPKDRHIKEIAAYLFNTSTLPNVREVVVSETENRGRDVAPWLVDMKPYQRWYDLFCHVHTKKSLHLGPLGETWRNYLYTHLLSPQAVQYVHRLFEQDKALGILFPVSFPNLMAMCVDNKVQLEGMYNETRIINQLTTRMGFKRTFCYNTLYFSLGTMMWYRPKALKPLFDLNFSYTDFPAEPIGVGGTLAHAIERLPTFVSEESGYKARMYTLR